MCLGDSVLVTSAAAAEIAGPAGSPEGGGLPPFLAHSEVDATSDTRAPGRYIVVLKDSVDHPGAVAEAQTEQSGRRLDFVYRSAFKGYSAKLPKGAAETLRRDPRVEYVAPDRKVKLDSQTTPYGLSRIFAPENEALAINGIDDVRVNADVAVIDTGIDYTHPDLNVVGRTDCTVETKCIDNSGTDGNGHGTHVAGTIGALDNAIGVVGVAPGVRLWAVKVLNDEGEGYDSWILAGIDWVTAHASEIEVANMSIAGYGPLPAESEAISASVSAGVVYTVSAGNDGRNAAGQRPANIPDAITVSGLADYDGKPGGLGSWTCRNWGSDDSLATFSNWGSGVDIAAPGTCIYSTWKGGKYEYDSGTSMASPHVAGAAAILAGKANPNSKKDVEAIRQTLVDEGSLAWTDASEDAKAEPLLYLGNKPIAGTEVSTAGFSSLDGKTATLTGAINARGLETEYQFEYGTTTEYGQKAPASLGKLAAGTKYTTVSETIGGLKPEQTYHYRLVAKNSTGVTYGGDRTFVPSRWTIQTPASDPEAQEGEWLNGVSCSTKDSCMAVGHYYTGDNLLVSYELNKAQWSYRSLPTPQGAGFSETDEVFCSTASACTAVGKYQTESNLVLPLIERWNGTGWSLQTISPPYSGAPYSRLRSVSCASTSECIAVGYYKNSGGTWVNYSARWKNNEWITLATPNPSGSAENDLEDVSCTSASFCVAVGWYRTSGGALRSEMMSWDGSAWTLQASAENFGTLYGTSCTSAEFCEAVGVGPAAVMWNGSKWSAQAAPGPAGNRYAYLYDVSCTSPNYCKAVGASFQGPRGSGLVEAWGGASWKPQTMPRQSEAGDLPWGVSCVTFAGCSAVGAAAVGEEAALIESLKDVTTNEASNVTASRATLNGSVNSEGLSTTYHFEYGATASYGTSVPIPDASAGSETGPVEVSQELTELPMESTYHYRIVASNAKGTLYGEDKTFRTGTVSPTLQATFGSYGSGEGQLNRPKGIAVDKDGNVWVVDGNNNRIEKFNSKGEYLGKIGSGGIGNGQLATPYDIAFTSSGNLWVTDTGNDRVQEFDPSGKYLAQFGSSGTGAGEFTYPKGIAVAPNGHIWVSDHLYGRVEEFSASGQFIRVVGKGGGSEVTFSYPDDVAVDNAGNVWVADRSNHRVQELSPTGELLSKFGSEGEANGQLKEPSAIAIKPSGDLLVTDRSTGRVQQFTAAGEYVTQFGYHNVSEQEGIAVAPNGVVYVSQSNQHRIEKWQQPIPEVVTQPASAVGTTEATLTGTVNPRGLMSSYHFEYGATTAYGNRVPVVNKEVGGGTEAVKVNEAISGLAPGTTYHCRLVGSNSNAPTFGEDVTFTTVPSTAGQLKGMPVTDPFDGSASAVSTFSKDWSALGWASGASPKGEDSAVGWRPVASFPTVNGARYSRTVTDTGSGTGAVVTMAINPGNAERYFSLWLDMPSSASTRAGYELRFTNVATNSYNVTLSRWVNGTQTGLASQAGYAFTNGSSLALVDQGGTVSAWTKTGSEFSQLLSASDTTFGGGSAAVEGAGNITRLTNFKVGALLTPVANMDAALKNLPLNDSFATNESPLSGGGAWAGLSWDNGTSGHNTGRVSSGWGPYDAYSAINGAYWQKATFADTGAGDAAGATLSANPGSTSNYFSLWLDMPSPSSARSGYEVRFTETSPSVYEVALSNWQAGAKTVLASKSGYSFPIKSQLALVDKAGMVSVWTNTGSEYAQLLSASDSTFTSGYTGIEGSGNSTRLANFRSGSLPPF